MATLSIKASEDRVNLIPKRVELPFERQVKILTNKPLECFYRSSEVIKSLTFSFFSFLMPILNFIFNRFRTHNVELINLKGDLAQNKFDALQNVLENPKLAPLVEFADHDDFEGGMACWTPHLCSRCCVCACVPCVRVPCVRECVRIRLKPY